MAKYTVPPDRGDPTHWCDRHPDVVTTWDITRLSPGLYTAALSVPCLKCWTEGRAAARYDGVDPATALSCDIPECDHRRSTRGYGSARNDDDDDVEIGSMLTIEGEQSDGDDRG